MSFQYNFETGAVSRQMVFICWHYFTDALRLHATKKYCSKAKCLGTPDVFKISLLENSPFNRVHLSEMFGGFEI